MKTKPPAPIPASMRRLITAGEAYLEEGNLVFTALHHQRRGQCCGSGCRHCPYVGGQGSTHLADPAPPKS